MSRLPIIQWFGLRSIPSRLRALVHYDVFPDFSAKVRRWFYNPLGVLVCSALASLLCGLFLHPQGFVLCGGISAVIVLGIVWPWLSLRGISGSISFDRTRVCEGAQVEVCLSLRNRLLWSLWGLSVRGGFLKEHGEVDSPGVSVASVPARRTVRCKWNFVPLCRGVYPLDISSASHPFYTGKMKFVDATGRVEKFQKNTAPITGRKHED